MSSRAAALPVTCSSAPMSVGASSMPVTTVNSACFVDIKPATLHDQTA